MPLATTAVIIESSTPVENKAYLVAIFDQARSLDLAQQNSELCLRSVLVPVNTNLFVSRIRQIVLSDLLLLAVNVISVVMLDIPVPNVLPANPRVTSAPRRDILRNCVAQNHLYRCYVGLYES